MPAKLVNNTPQVGPYPGRTWVEEANAVKRSLFGYMVPAKIDQNQCDCCMKPCSPEYSCCSKQCYEDLKADRISEARAEARAS